MFRFSLDPNDPISDCYSRQQRINTMMGFEEPSSSETLLILTELCTIMTTVIAVIYFLSSPHAHVIHSVRYHYHHLG